MATKETAKKAKEMRSWGGRVVESILIIDDNKDAAKALAELLGHDGYSVALAHDGEEGIALAAESDPDVVIVDMKLPGKDGYEVARILRKKNSSVLLIALTGYYGR